MDTILIVDDEPDIRAVMRFALEDAEFRVLEADHAAQAHRLMTTETPDLLLLDWLLPGQSGLEMAQQIKLDPKTRRVPIIMVSARGTEDDRVIGLNSGVDDYITKPFSPREMIARSMLSCVAPGQKSRTIPSRSAACASTTSVAGSASETTRWKSHPPNTGFCTSS